MSKMPRRLRVVPPAHSVLSLGAIAAGARGALAGGPAPAEALAGRLQTHFGAAEVVLTDSGTSALRLAIEEAAARAPGRPIALPAWACFDILTAVLGAKAPYVFYDLEVDSLAPASHELARVAAEVPAAIVIVHAFGNPVDIRAVRDAMPAATLVIEDAAQAWGSHVAGVPSGGTGDLGVLSFSRGKGITGGSGGALLHRVAHQRHSSTPDEGGRDASVARGAPLRAPRGFRDVAGCLVQWTLGRPWLYGLPASIPGLGLGETRYHEPREVGRISRAAAATLTRTFAPALAAAARRAERGTALRALVARSSRLHNVTVQPMMQPSWLRLPVLAPDQATRDALLAAGRPWGLAGSYPRPLTMLAQELGVPARMVSDDAGASAIAARIFSLPTHDLVGEADLRALERVLAAT